MIIRKYTACPACDAPIMLRVGVGYAHRQVVTVACQTCGSLSRGELIAKEEWPELILPGMPDLEPDDHTGWHTITMHADFPIPVPSSIFSPFLAAMQYLEDRAEVYFAGVGRFRGLVDKVDAFQRAYELQIRGNWELANRNIARHFIPDWNANSTSADCQAFFHRALFLSLCFIDPKGRYADAKCEIWSRTYKKEDEFAKVAARMNSQGDLERLQTRVAEQLFALIRSADQWVNAVPIIYARALGKRNSPDWRIPADNFRSLRDAYRQNFELSCQALSLVIRMQNIAEGRDAEVIVKPGEANAWVPRMATSKTPRNVNQFERSNSATKELFLNRSPQLRHFWGQCFDRGLRNAISHADADYSPGSGLIRTKNGDFWYHEFLESVAWQVSLLSLWLDLIKLWRIYATCWDSTKLCIVNR